MKNRFIPIQRCNLQYIATLPEDCEVTAMCEHKGMVYVATDTGNLWSFDPETLEFTEIKCSLDTTNQQP